MPPIPGINRVNYMSKSTGATLEHSNLPRSWLGMFRNWSAKAFFFFFSALQLNTKIKCLPLLKIERTIYELFNILADCIYRMYKEGGGGSYSVKEWDKLAT